MDDTTPAPSENPKTGSSSLPDLTTASLLSGTLWMVLGAALIYFFHDQSITELFRDGQAVLLQLFWGVLFGVIFGLAGWAMFKNPQLKNVLDDYSIIKMVKEFDLSNFQIFHISLVAGITEEFLFRAAIQPLIGIWLTSLLFIGIHGYIKFRSPVHLFFTLFTFFLSMMLGYLFIYSGIIAAMAAHAVYDMIVLWVVKNSSSLEADVSR
jgi:uncharacterized protein